MWSPHCSSTWLKSCPWWASPGAVQAVIRQLMQGVLLRCWDQEEGGWVLCVEWGHHPLWTQTGRKWCPPLANPSCECPSSPVPDCSTYEASSWRHHVFYITFCPFRNYHDACQKKSHKKKKKKVCHISFQVSDCLNNAATQHTAVWHFDSTITHNSSCHSTLQG